MKHLALALLLACGCDAQVSVGEVTVNGKKVHEDLSVPQSFELTPAYGEKQGLKIPLRAHVEVPRGDAVVVKEGKAAGGSWIRFDFPDASGEKIAERLSIGGVNIGMGPPPERLAALAKMLAERVLPQVANGAPDLKSHGSRPISVGGNQGVMVVGQFTAPGGELFYIGIAATLLPESEQGIMIVGQAVNGTSPITSPADVGTKGALFDLLQTLTIKPA